MCSLSLLECPIGTYGKECNQQCGFCQCERCDIITGKCPIACADGFQAPFCKVEIISNIKIYSQNTLKGY